MKTFDCRVADAQGKKQVLQRSGPAEEWIIRDLTQEGYFILEICESSVLSHPTQKRMKLKTVIDFTQTLATLMGNGLTLKETLKLAAQMFPESSQQAVFQRIDEQVNKGDSLYQCLAAWRGSFPPLYLGLIKIGEKTGDLAGVLTQLTEYLSTRKALRDKTGNALAYPVFVLVMAVAGLTLLTLFVFPALTSIIGSLNQAASQAYARNIQQFQSMATAVAVCLAMVAGAWGTALWRRTKSEVFQERYDSLILRIPLVKGYLFAQFGLNFSFALETLLVSGYSLEESLAEGAQVVTNLFLKKKLLKIREEVIKGRLLSQSFRQEAVFPRSFVAWIAVGEGAHDLKKSFGQLKRFYQQELDNYHHRFLNLVEPTLILLVGGLLILLVINFITPVFSMMGNLLQ